MQIPFAPLPREVFSTLMKCIKLDDTHLIRKVISHTKKFWKFTCKYILKMYTR